MDSSGGPVQQYADELRTANTDNGSFYAAAPDKDTGVVTVYSVKGSAASRSGASTQVPPVPAGVTVRYETAVMSEDLQARILEALIDANTRLAPLGARLTQKSPLELGGPIVAFYDPDKKPVDAALMASVAGDDWPAEVFDPTFVEFRPGSPAPFESRISDQSPLSGGARLHGPSGLPGSGTYANCSSGWAVKSRDTSF